MHQPQTRSRVPLSRHLTLRPLLEHKYPRDCQIDMVTVFRSPRILRFSTLLRPLIPLAQAPFLVLTALNWMLNITYPLPLVEFMHRRVACPCRYRLWLRPASAVEAAVQTLFVALVLIYQKRRNHQKRSRSRHSNSLRTPLFVLSASRLRSLGG